MKKIIIILIVAIGLVSFKTIIINEYLITGTIDGVENGRTITLEKQNDAKGIVVVDSAKIVDGKFSFKGNTTEPSIHFIHIKDIVGKIPFIVEEGKINLIIFKDSITKSKISGTVNNDYLNIFNVSAQKIQKKMIDFQNLNMQKMTDAQTKQDTETINGLMKEYTVFQDEMKLLTSNYPDLNPKSFISVLFLENLLNDPKADIEKIKKTYSNLDETLKKTKSGKAIQEKIDNLKLSPPVKSVGMNDIAPDFSAPNPDGKIISLNKSLGKVTIIDFWASWCGPCRRENPNVVALYKEFHGKGLNIVGVSLDKTLADWQKAIAKDGITWIQVSNLKFWEDPIAKLYNVQQIPTTFILDKSGKIIAQDLRGPELRTKIIELLSK